MAIKSFAASCQATVSNRDAGLASWGRVRSLPQNLIVSAGSLITGSEAGFEVAADWTVANGSASDNTTQKVNGNQSLRLLMNGTSNTMTTSRTDLNEDLSASDQIQMAVYVAAMPSTNLQIVLSNNTGFTVTATRTIATFLSGDGIHQQELMPGQWATINLQRGEFTLAGGFSWSNPIVAFRFVITDTGQDADLSIDYVRVGVETLPAVLLQTDDCYDSDYNIIYDEAWLTRQMRTTHFIISGLMDTAGRLTTAQALTMYNANLDIGNHSDENVALTTYGSQALVEQHLQACIDYLENNSMERAKFQLAYPQGQWDDTVKNGLAGVGMLTARNAYNAAVQLTLPQYYWYHVKATPLERDNTTLNEAKGYIDDALARNEIAVIYTHDISATPGYYGWTTANFTALLDYIVGKDIAVLTISDLYELTSKSLVVPNQFAQTVSLSANCQAASASSNARLDIQGVVVVVVVAVVVVVVEG